MRSGSLHVHEPRYKTQNYGANDHQDSLLGGHDLDSPRKKKPRLYSCAGLSTRKATVGEGRETLLIR